MTVSIAQWQMDAIYPVAHTVFCRAKPAFPEVKAYHEAVMFGQHAEPPSLPDVNTAPVLHDKALVGLGMAIAAYQRAGDNPGETALNHLRNVMSMTICDLVACVGWRIEEAGQ